jgi:hypothetical protein
MENIVTAKDILSDTEIELLKSYFNNENLYPNMSFMTAEKIKHEAIHKLIGFMIEKNFI